MAAAEEPEPAPETAPAPPPTARSAHLHGGVGDHWAISERFYGDGSKYQRIAEASGIATLT